MRIQFNQVLLHTLIPSLPASISYSISFEISTCWNLKHRNLLRLTTSVMHFMPSRLLSSALAVALFKWTPHIHLTIIRSVLSKLSISSTFIAQVLPAYPKILGIQPCIFFLSLGQKIPLSQYCELCPGITYSCSWCFFCSSSCSNQVDSNVTQLQLVSRQQYVRRQERINTTVPETNAVNVAQVLYVTALA